METRSSWFVTCRTELIVMIFPAVGNIEEGLGL